MAQKVLNNVDYENELVEFTSKSRFLQASSRIGERALLVDVTRGWKSLLHS